MWVSRAARDTLVSGTAEYFYLQGWLLYHLTLRVIKQFFLLKCGGKIYEFPCSILKTEALPISQQPNEHSLQGLSSCPGWRLKNPFRPDSNGEQSVKSLEMGRLLFMMQWQQILYNFIWQHNKPALERVTCVNSTMKLNFRNCQHKNRPF